MITPFSELQEENQWPQT